MSGAVDAPDYSDIELPPRGLDVLPREEVFGDVPVRVDAVCTGCKRIEVKTVRVLDPRKNPGSFRHVCHGCKVITWWNAIKILSNVLPAETVARIEEFDRLDDERTAAEEVSA